MVVKGLSHCIVRTMMNRKGASVSPCNTPACIILKCFALTIWGDYLSCGARVCGLNGSDNSWWNATGLQDSEHFSSMYGVEGLFKIHEVDHHHHHHHHHHHLSLLSSWRMGPLILLLQAAKSLAATSASPHDVNPRRSFSLFIVLRHVSLVLPLLRLPSGAHVSAILGVDNREQIFIFSLLYDPPESQNLCNH